MFQRMRILLVAAALVLTCLMPEVATAASTPHHHRSTHPSCAAPGAPPQVSANAGANQATVTWQAAPGNGSQITAYVVTAYQASSPSIAVATIGNTLAATLYDLVSGTSYTIQVYALSSCGAGPATSSNKVMPTGSSTTYASSVEADSPTVYYRLSEVSGTTAADSSGNNALGTYATGVGLGVTGAIESDPDTAASWNGNCCGLLTSSPTLATGNGTRTVEAWIKTTDPSFRVFAGYGQGGYEQAFNVGVGPGQVGLLTNSDDRYWNTHTLNDGNWHYIVMTYDGQNATAYVDGQSLGSQSYPSGINTQSGGLTLGCGFGGNYNCFNGSIDEVAIYSKVLAASDIAARFALSGYSRPGAPGFVTTSYGGEPNALLVSWGVASANGSPLNRYVIAAYQSSTAKNATATSGSKTSVKMYGLASGVKLTFQVYASNSYGDGPIATSSAVTPTGASTTYASSVQAAGPAVYYRLDELSGPTAADSSGNNALGAYLSGTGLGMSGAIQGEPDTAVSWKGGCCGLLTSNPTLALANGARTVEGWIKTTDPSFRVFAGYGQYGYEEAFNVGVGPNQIGLLTLSDDRYWNTHTLNDGNWHYIVVTYDGQNATAYVDGQSLGSQSYPNGINTQPSSLTVGCGFGGNYNCFNGSVDEVALYNKVLTAAQISSHFALSTDSRPGAPTNVQVTGGTNSATVTWSAPTSGTQPLTGYIITAYQGTSAETSVATGGSSSTATVYGLAGGVSYTFKVYAINAFGSGAVATTSAVTPGGASTTYASTVQANGPIAYYRLSELSGNTAADSSGHNVPGIYAGGVLLGITGAIEGDPDTAASWNGNCCGLLTSTPNLALANGARTVEGWIKTTDSSFRVFAGYGQYGYEEAFNVGVGPNQIGLLTLSDDRYWNTHTLNDGNWHYIVVTYDGQNATAYVDGQSLGSQSYPNGINTQSSRLTIGCGFGGNYNCFNGLVDEVAIYNKTLTAAQIATHFTLSGYSRPGAPTNVQVTGGTNSATVTWSAPTSGTLPLTGYVVTAYQGTSAKTAVATRGSGSTATVYGLSGGVSYTFKVYAINTFGNGAVATTSAVTPTGASTTYASTVQAAGPIAYYRLGELSGNTVADSSGHNVPGIYANGVLLGISGGIQGDPDRAVFWNGNCCALLTSTPKLATGNGARSIEFWIKTTSASFQVVAGYGQYGYEEAFNVGFGSNEVALLTLNDDRYWSSPILDDGNWHYIVVTYDGQNAVAYVDGQSLGSRSYPNGINTQASSLTVGCGFGGNYSCLNGIVDEVAIYNKALTAAQVAAHYQAAGY